MGRMARKNAAAVALGRKGGKKGGPARAAKLTPEQRNESARKAVRARWAKAKGAKEGGYHIVVKSAPGIAEIGTSDHALLELLKRLKASNDPTEVRQLSEQLERVIFHKQYENA